MLYLSIFPTTLFLFAVYSESLYLLLTVAAFLLAVRGRWGWAGVVVGLAALTRVSGVILLPALAVLAWRSADRKGALLRLAISLPVMALWPLYLGLVHGRPFVFLSAQRAGLGSPALLCRPARRRLGRARRRLARRPPARRRLGPRLLPEHRPQRDVRRRA